MATKKLRQVSVRFSVLKQADRRPHAGVRFNFAPFRKMNSRSSSAGFGLLIKYPCPSSQLQFRRKRELFGGLNSFGDDIDAQVLRKPDNGL